MRVVGLLRTDVPSKVTHKGDAASVDYRSGHNKEVRTMRGTSFSSLHGADDGSQSRARLLRSTANFNETTTRNRNGNSFRAAALQQYIWRVKSPRWVFTTCCLRVITEIAKECAGPSLSLAAYSSSLSLR